MKEIRFAKNMKILLKLAEYSQESFAEEIDTSVGVVFSYCNGKVNPTLPKLCRIAEILRVDLDTLVYADLENNPQKYRDKLTAYKV